MLVLGCLLIAFGAHRLGGLPESSLESHFIALFTRHMSHPNL